MGRHATGQPGYFPPTPVPESRTQAELRNALAARKDLFRAMVTQQFDALGVGDSRRRAADFVDLLNGLLFDAITGPGPASWPAPACARPSAGC